MHSCIVARPATCRLCLCTTTPILLLELASPSFVHERVAWTRRTRGADHAERLKGKLPHDDRLLHVHICTCRVGARKAFGGGRHGEVRRNARDYCSHIVAFPGLHTLASCARVDAGTLGPIHVCTLFTHAVARCWWRQLPLIDPLPHLSKSNAAGAAATACFWCPDAPERWRRHDEESVVGTRLKAVESLSFT